MSSTSSSATTTGSASNLFPTTTASSGSNNINNPYGTNPTIYYFVFLGVLLVLMAAGGCLAYRAYRVRRRYRRAREAAFARGEAPPGPDGRDYYLGIGGLFTFEIAMSDRDGVLRGGGIGGAGAAGRRGRWERLPALWEGEVEDSDETEKRRAETNELDTVQPVSLLSLVPLEPDTMPLLDHDVPPSAYGGRRGRSGAGGRDRSSSRRPPLRDFLSGNGSAARARSAAARDNLTTGGAGAAGPSAGKAEPPMVQVGEPIRLAVVVRMPRDPADVQKEREAMRARSFLSDEDDEEERTGWEQGMAIGVWEGEVGPSGRAPN